MAPKIAILRVLDKKYPVLFSLFALREAQQGYGGLKKWQEAMEDDQDLNAAVDLAQSLIVSGCEYCNLMSITPPGMEGEPAPYTPPSKKELLLSLQTANDLQALMDVLQSALAAVQSPSVVSVAKRSKKKKSR